MINVTKTFLPPFEEYLGILKRSWDKCWITNNGELVIELEEKLRKYLEVDNLWYCNNGTSALQLAIKALSVNGEVITTPFSYVATTTSILWENCTPIYVDIKEDDFCIDIEKIESKISSRTKAILVTHVYGYPCNVEAIEAIATKYSLKVIYDGAHAFGTKYMGRSLLSYGDISICSFHATKLFHTVEGGCIIANNSGLSEKVLLYRQFGHKGDEYFTFGINAKNSELHAAMGLVNLRYLESIMANRKRQWLFYKYLLAETGYKFMDVNVECARIEYNYAYFPLVFNSENELITAINELKKREIIPRRYFYPALNSLPYVRYQPCPIAESIANRVICLPLFDDLKEPDQEKICNVIKECAKS
jgi:dTDP-4-amino-4,6-dideoxygalactose transaminase